MILRTDLPASLIVFLVAVPLSLGVAIASGAPVMAGLITAAVGGIVAGSLGGVSLQVSGPAAGLIVVVAGLVERYGFAATCAITCAAGVLQLILGLSGVARAALALSPAVLHAMLAGIGITIILGQIHAVLGGSPQSDVWSNLHDLPGQIRSADVAPTVLGLLVAVALIVWFTLPGRLRRLPGALIVVLLATVIASAAGLDVPRVSVPKSFAGSLTFPGLPHHHWFGVVTGVLTVALVASVESMLSAVAIDQLQPGRRSDLDRELRGQGIANAVSGLLGGLPITGVIVRSTTNAQSGARTRASAIFHGIWVILFAVLLSGWLERIPLAVLAGLLLAVGVRLVNLAHIKAIHRHGDLPIYVVTLAGVVGIGVLEGVLIGIALTLILVVRRVVWAQVSALQSGAGWRVVIEGRLSFLTIPRLSRALGQVPPGAPVTLELVLDYLDQAAYEHIVLWKERHVAGGGTVTVDEVGTVKFAQTGSGAAVRQDRRFHYVLPRWFSPWSHWQQSSTGGLQQGLSEYQRRGADLVRPFYSELIDEHAPTVMFLTCADARVMPNLITMSGPGDLFTVRNLGNLIPRYGEDPDASVISALQYAVDVLHVSELVVCGHSGCGAMTALLSGPDSDLEWLQKWLAAAEPTMERWRSGPNFADTGLTEVNRLVLTNLRQQLDNAQTIPFVQRAVQDGRLRITAAFFDIGTASLSTYDEDSGTFSTDAEPPADSGKEERDADSDRRGTREDSPAARGKARRSRG